MNAREIESNPLSERMRPRALCMALASLSAALLGGLPGCVAPPPPVYKPGLEKERSTRVNFRPEGAVLRGANFLILESTIPAGTPARITSYTATEIKIALNDRSFRMVPGSAARFPTDDAGIDNFLEKYFADRAGDMQVEAMGPPELKDKVMQGLYMIGMTKEQVYTCLGPPYKIGTGTPALADTPGLAATREQILASDKWVYPRQLILFVPTFTVLYFGDGKLQKVEG